MLYTQVVGASVLKGIIYGIFLPISMLGVALSTPASAQEFSKHFIPMSTYGQCNVTPRVNTTTRIKIAVDDKTSDRVA